MQLLIGVGGSWKCVDVALVDGWCPCVAGSNLTDINIEPAMWYKVLVLDCICVDCSERVITWNVRECECCPLISECDQPAALHSAECDQPAAFHSTGTLNSLDSCTSPSSLTATPPSTPPSSLIPALTTSSAPSGLVREHSLMAPHDDDSMSVYTDDLQSLFELAQVLYRASSQTKCRAQRVEQMSWFRLIHYYLLPLVTLSVEDVQSVMEVKCEHRKTLEAMDQAMLEITTQTMQIKEFLSTLRATILPTVREWAEQRKCSPKFLELLTCDLRAVEEQARTKIQSSILNLEVCVQMTASISSGTKSKLTTQCSEGGQLLSDTLMLRAALHEIMANTKDQDWDEGEEKESQDEYIRLHSELACLRTKCSHYSQRKVLALSVREAIHQAIECFECDGTTRRMDLRVRGGQSTDVLSHMVKQQLTDVNSTLGDKLYKVLRQSGSLVAQCHTNFCSRLKQEWFPDFSDEYVLVPHSHALLAVCGDKRSPSQLPHSWSIKQPLATQEKMCPDLKQLSRTVQQHFERIMELICSYYNNHDSDFGNRMWLCYEQVFFEIFYKDFISIYQSSENKFCEGLQLNSLGVSLMDPAPLELDIPNKEFLTIFLPRTFDLATQIYKKPELWRMTFDLQSLSLVTSPIEKLQLLTSAFRKCMASLSQLKVKLLKAAGTGDVDFQQAAVSCDDLLPVLVLVLLQLHPAVLASLHVDTIFLTDYIAPFLTNGWHGYSLASFSSAVQIISQL